MLGDYLPYNLSNYNQIQNPLCCSAGKDGRLQQQQALHSLPLLAVTTVVLFPIIVQIKWDS